jgi:hypothetical protein
MQLLQGSVETTALVIGEAFAPALEIGANALIKILNVFNELPAPIRNTGLVIGALGVGVAGLVVGSPH